MKSLIGTLAVLAVLVAAPAAGTQERVCTAIGCHSGISLRLTDDQGQPVAPRVAAATLCLDDTCRRFRARDDFVRLDVPDQHSAGPVRVRIVLRDRANRVLRRYDRAVTLSRTQPNGPECEPICWQAAFALRPGLRIARTA